METENNTINIQAERFENGQIVAREMTRWKIKKQSVDRLRIILLDAKILPANDEKAEMAIQVSNMVKGWLAGWHFSVHLENGRYSAAQIPDDVNTLDFRWYSHIEWYLSAAGGNLNALPDLTEELEAVRWKANVDSR